MIPCGCSGPTCCKEKPYRVPGSPNDDPEQHGHELETLEDCRSLNGGNYDCACYYVIDNRPPPAPQDPALPKPHGRKMSAADRARILKKGQVIKIDCIRTKKGNPDSPLAGHHGHGPREGDRSA